MPRRVVLSIERAGIRPVRGESNQVDIIHPDGRRSRYLLVTSRPSGISCPGDCSEAYVTHTKVVLEAATGVLGAGYDTPKGPGHPTRCDDGRDARTARSLSSFFRRDHPGDHAGRDRARIEPNLGEQRRIRAR